MPDSIGKRKRKDVNAKKQVAREERRVARAERRRDREAGLIEPGPPIGPAKQAEWLRVPGAGEGETARGAPPAVPAIGIAVPNAPADNPSGEGCRCARQRTTTSRPSLIPATRTSMTSR